MPLDITLSPLYRIHGQEAASFPGLAAVAPPRKTARGREQDYLAVQLILTGNASFSVSDYAALTALAGERFHQTSGPLTSALRAAAEAVNESLLERNLSTSGRGQYAVGWLALVAVREGQCTFLLSGPMHVVLLGEHCRHIFEPTLSGRGLGVSKSSTRYFTQAEIKPGERIILTGRLPSAWDSLPTGASPVSLEAARRQLLSLTNEDLHAVLLYVTEGTGRILLPSLPAPAAPVAAAEPSTVQTELAQQEGSTQAAAPSAYAIPAEPEAAAAPAAKAEPRTFPPSIPRLKPAVPQPEPAPADPGQPEAAAPALREPSRVTRRAAKAAVGGIRAYRSGIQRLKDGVRHFLPRLFPGDESGMSRPIPAYILTLIALAVPVIVVAAAMAVYFKFGQTAQYENYLRLAQDAQRNAATLQDPVMQRDAWQEVLLRVEKAESYRETPETESIREDAESRLDSLLGVLRLEFKPAFSSGLGIEISRMAATENDLYLLDARQGEIVHAQLTGRGFQKDPTFSCKPGLYGGYQVGPLVDILALPLLNSVKATVVGVDASGNLLYCAPGQVAQAIPLPPPDTNWGRVTAMTLDAGNLYVLDAPSRAVWVYVGKDGAFVDRPYFFFTEQIPAIQDGIDLAVKDDTLFLLHSDGHLSTCSYSRLETVPTRCEDPAQLTNPFAAYKDMDLFAQAHITQMMYTSPPDSTILLLGADSQGVLRLTPASLELQNQIRPAAGRDNPLPSGTPIDAMTASPNHVLYLAVKDQVYFAENMP